MNFERRAAQFLLLLALVTGLTRSATAHPMGFGNADLAVKADSFLGELILDSPPEYADQKNPAPHSSEGPQGQEQRNRELKQQVEQGFVLVFDGQPSKTQARVLALGTGPQATDVVRVFGQVPAGAKTLVIRTSTEQGDMGVEIGGPLLPDSLRGLVSKNSESPVLHLGPNPPEQAWSRVRTQAPAAGSPGAVASASVDRKAFSAEPENRPKTERFRLTFWEYVTLGFRHIIPHGADHMLFVVGLLLSHTLLPGRWSWLRGLALQLSVFTVAHSVTLALGSLGAVSANSRIIEPLIALSIVYVGIEPLLLGWWLDRAGAANGPKSQRLALWRRSSVVFLFGLLHGLGFAAALATRGLDPGALFSSLLAFNLGVEGGQLCVAAVGAALCFGLRPRPFYKTWVLAPLCALISGVGLFWFIERLS